MTKMQTAVCDCEFGFTDYDLSNVFGDGGVTPEDFATVFSEDMHMAFMRQIPLWKIYPGYEGSSILCYLDDILEPKAGSYIACFTVEITCPDQVDLQGTFMTVLKDMGVIK